MSVFKIWGSPSVKKKSSSWYFTHAWNTTTDEDGNIALHAKGKGSQRVCLKVKIFWDEGVQSWQSLVWITINDLPCKTLEHTLFNSILTEPVRCILKYLDSQWRRKSLKDEVTASGSMFQAELRLIPGRLNSLLPPLLGYSKTFI